MAQQKLLPVISYRSTVTHSPKGLAILYPGLLYSYTIPIPLFNALYAVSSRFPFHAALQHPHRSVRLSRTWQRGDGDHSFRRSHNIDQERSWRLIFSCISQSSWPVLGTPYENMHSRMKVYV